MTASMALISRCWCTGIAFKGDRKAPRPDATKLCFSTLTDFPRTT